MTDIIKFIHIIVTLALLGTTAYCLLIVVGRRFVLSPNDKDLLRMLNKSLLYLAFFAALTGTFLVYPKHFTFHTLWIQAAYALVIVFFAAVLALLLFNRRRNRILWIAFYGMFIAILVVVVHDAVTKTTFLF